MVPFLAGNEVDNDALAVVVGLGKQGGFLAYDGDVNTDINMKLSAALAESIFHRQSPK